MKAASSAPASSAPPAPLSLIIELSRAMLEAARQSDWVAVAEYEQKRRAMITRAFSAAAGAVAVGGLAAEIEQVLRLDRELMALAEGARNDCAAQLRTLRNGKKALRAYGSSDPAR